jgi:methanogenic corrinoid protein MtbC1
VRHAIIDLRGPLAEELTKRQHASFGELLREHGVERQKLLEYTHYFLACLVNAIDDSRPELLKEYLRWVKALFESNGIPLEALKENMNILLQVLTTTLPQDTHGVVTYYLQTGLSEIEEVLVPQDSFIDARSAHGKLARQYLDAVLSADRRTASRLILTSFRNGVGVKDIYLHVLQPVQREVGRLWHAREISVGQEHLASSVTQLVMSQLYPHVCAIEKRGRTFVATCVGGEIHEIGIRMVSDFFEMEGWDTVLLGANVPSGDVVETVIQHNAEVLGISATMSSSVMEVKKLVAILRVSQAAHTTVVVGGYAFNIAPSQWKRVGADYYADSAESALRIAETRADEGEGN